MRTIIQGNKSSNWGAEFMVHGIAIMGLNGCGKSTLAHEICKQLHYFEIDLEDYFFPEQKKSRQSILEHQYDVECEHLGKIPYSVSRSKKEVQEMIRDEIKKHTQFVISGVTMNWDEDILAAIDVAFILEVPTEERVKRVQHREEIRFGSRVLPGGDMYEQHREFSNRIADKRNQTVEESANKLKCVKVKLDGTKSVNENVAIVMRTIEKL